jgi:hypothetical protein
LAAAGAPSNECYKDMLYQLRKAVDVCSTLWFACSYAPHTPHTYTPRSTHLSPEHTTGKNATRYASRQSRSVEAWGTTSLPPKAQAASFRVLHPTL